ncbi:MAG: precorrin-2 C(20)-methyltransferase [Rhodospirillaceae bacterium]|jgi:precorrin-2/cobalt-factor-2 C20-methyltransferase|nr:precorrin-2 C(20)-methyltransferase [Alphaproteobacteria bacterium]MBT4219041.1 precorrin-2 C(20)-methyltransferase [Rhodospirillaceae bacterium]MBT4463141.1 precorrin-2 C(20)-methyltransferase [Rhodospirillaceae bacterium]MBT5308288.1 precorrin-2 C(20)-methyltransferase [Rhodospirillaceae bacterium]MBT6406334.1 precorrin-2 C(20)-methyltransferase [Rhodospirillaceae bacterium]
MSGTLYGVGVGPGDPELLTLKAARVLGEVPVVVFVCTELKGVAGPSMARGIVADHITPDKTEIAIPIEMSEDLGHGRRAYDAACITISEHLSAGRDVAMLCEGDPLLYGSFMYVLERLGSEFKAVTIPGVSSLGAAAADANLSLVSRTESLLVVPATIDEATLQDRLAMTDAAAIFKVGRHMAKIKRVLGTLGRVDDATYVERASGVDGRVLAFTDAPDKAPYFSMVLVTKRNAP